MITLGDCNGCPGCADGGGVVCDRICFSNSQYGMPAAPGEFVGAANEGDDIAFWVLRFPNCFIYDGDPTAYETAEGHPATDIIPEGQYFFDAPNRAFWQNIAGTMAAVATPSWFKQGSVSGDVKIDLPSCSCTAHMIQSTANVSFTFADGDDTAVPVTIPTACPGPPVFWGCQGQPGGVEIATLTFEGLSATGGCVTAGNYAHGIVTCTHVPPHADWGTWPYTIKTWEASIIKPIGFLPFNWDYVTWPVDRYLYASKELVTPGGTYNGETELIDNAAVVGPYYGAFQGPRYKTYNYDSEASKAGGGPITGAVNPDTYFFDYGFGETVSLTLANQSGTLDEGYLIPDSEINGLLADAIANDPDGTQGNYAIYQPEVEYTWKFLASDNPDAFADPAFDPTKTYEYTGFALPDSPFNPDDWAETAATGFSYYQELSGTPTASYTYGPSFGLTGYGAASFFKSVLASFPTSVTRGAARKITIDATNSLTNNPEPARVFVTVSYYEDTTLISTEPETEITDTSFDIEVTSLGGATFLAEKRFEIRVEYLNAPFCGPTPSAVFVCHPGLTSDPCA